VTASRIGPGAGPGGTGGTGVKTGWSIYCMDAERRLSDIKNGLEMPIGTLISASELRTERRLSDLSYSKADPVQW
jgi:hypothetical protein